MKVLVIDVGGTHVKLLATGRRVPVKIDSGPHLSAAVMAREVKAAVQDWAYDVISIGFPGPVVHGRPMSEPVNLGPGWVRYDFERAFDCPVKVINDAAMQALGSYEGGRMLFAGLGTGLGVAAILDGYLVPMEVGHLPYHHGYTYEDYLGTKGLKRLGRRKWEAHVHDVVTRLRLALICEYVVIGGGNARLLRRLPPNARLGSNANAFLGGFRLWRDPTLIPVGGSPRPRILQPRRAIK
jgi:polyphosphate glucokinase